MSYISSIGVNVLYTFMFRMNFRDFLYEAEIVGGQLMGSEQAALRIVLPFRNSNWHMLTLLDGPHHPIHSPKQGSIIDCMTVEEFLTNGLAGWNDDDTPRPRHLAVLQVIDKNAAIRCLDGTHMTNPWQWLNFDANFMRQAAVRGLPDMKPVMYQGKEISPGGAPNWEKIAHQMFHGPDPFAKPGAKQPDLSDQERDDMWRAKLAKTIYGDLPDVYAKGTRRDTMYTDKYYQRYGKVMRGADIDIVAEHCPLSKGGFIKVFNPRIVREVARFQIRSTFDGYRSMGGGFLATRPAAEKEATGVEDKLNDIFQNIADVPEEMSRRIGRIMDSDEMMHYMAGEEVEGIGSFVFDVLDDIHTITQTGDMEKMIRGLYKASRLIGMMRSRSGQNFSDAWDGVAGYNLEFYKNILVGLRGMSKLIKDQHSYKEGDKYYRDEAAKLDKWRADLTRSIMAFADVTGQSTEVLRHRLGLFNI